VRLQLEIIEKSWEEFWAYYWRVTSRHRIPGIFEWDQKLVSLIEEKCNVCPPKRILDLGCGGGDQAKVFTERGYTVVGIDVAESLIEYARGSVDGIGLSATFDPSSTLPGASTR
jgi:2-polyprenyl-3-methyl-5-hydroxy-6-metoxy-1,4-benzoquinol methylase